MIIDAHAHIFPAVSGFVAAGLTRGVGYGRVSIGNATIQFMPPLSECVTHTPQMLLAHMEWAGVDKAILLQGPFYGEFNQYVREALRLHPDKFLGAAYVDPWPPGSRKEFDTVCAEGDFSAVKLECSEGTGLFGVHQGAVLDDQAIAWLWEELERLSMVLTVDLGAVGSRSYQTQALRRIAEEHPTLRIVIAHLAQPTPAVEADPALRRQWEEQIDLGLLPNVWFDTASLPAYVADEGYPYPGAGRYLRMAIDRIGPGKILWGSDIPGVLVHANYQQLIGLARMHLQFLPSADQAAIMGANAERVYKHGINVL
jgi:predicted TIM-barrel fold metal-dependent hydrolase